METTLNKDAKIGGKTHKNSSIANLAELFVLKDLQLQRFLMGTMLIKLGQIMTKNARKFVH